MTMLSPTPVYRDQVDSTCFLWLDLAIASHCWLWTGVRAELELNKSWTRAEQEMNKSWTRVEQELKKSWTRVEQELNKSWTIVEQELNTS